eukprot:362747-Chlamydomonas_euryale.AAC.4
MFPISGPLRPLPTHTEVPALHAWTNHPNAALRQTSARSTPAQPKLKFCYATADTIELSYATASTRTSSPTRRPSAAQVPSAGMRAIRGPGSTAPSMRPPPNPQRPLTNNQQTHMQHQGAISCVNNRVLLAPSPARQQAARPPAIAAVATTGCGTISTKLSRNVPLMGPRRQMPVMGPRRQRRWHVPASNAGLVETARPARAGQRGMTRTHSSASTSRPAGNDSYAQLGQHDPASGE